MLKFAVAVLPVLLARGVLSSTNCAPYGEPVANRCTPEDQKNPEFADLDTLMRDAMTFENLPDFVLQTTISMYLFLHPCLGDSQAAVVLFYQQKFPVSQEALIGRRKRADAFSSYEDLLHHKFDDITQQTSADCIQYLIDRYVSVSAERFKVKHPHFSVPPTTAIIHTTTATTASNAAATSNANTNTNTNTTSGAPLQSPVTSTNATTTAASASLQTTVTSSVTFGPLSCSSCTGLLCLLGNHVTKCPDGEICQTTVEDTDTGRQITRGCSPQALCVDFGLQQNQTMCSQVDQQILPYPTTCRFCCVSDACNRPPHVIPASDTIYPQP